MEKLWSYEYWNHQHKWSQSTLATTLSWQTILLGASVLSAI